MAESFDSIRRRVALNRMTRASPTAPDATDAAGRDASPAGASEESVTQEAPKIPDKFVVLIPGDVPESPMGGRYAVDETIDVAATPGALVRNGYRLRPVTDKDNFNVRNSIQIAELDSSPPGPDAVAAGAGTALPETTPRPASTVPEAVTPAPLVVAGAPEAVPPGPPPAPPGPQPPQQPPPNPPEVGQASDIQPGPQWAAGYFAGVAGDFSSWRKFDAARFADVKVLTRDEIRLNPEKQQLLGELMIALDPAMAERVANRIASQTLDPSTSQPYDSEEQKFEDFARFELSAVYKRFEAVEQKFDIKVLERLLATRDDLRALIGQRGPEHTLAAFKKEIMHTLVRGRADSDKFFDNFKKLTEREASSRGQAMERKIQDFCTKHSIPRANYDMLVVAGDKKATRENLERYIHDHSGKFRKWVDTTRFANLLPGTSYRAAARRAELAARAAPTESSALRPRSWATSDIHEARRDIGEFLSMTVAGQEFRERLEHYTATGETMPEPSERQGPRTFAESQTEGVALTSERNVQRMFNRDLALQATRSGYRSVEEMPMPERQAFHQNWGSGEIYEQASGRGLGFLSIIARAFARLLFGKAKEKVKWDDQSIK